MGHFNKQGFLARDGSSKIADFNQFGQEWQGLQSEPLIFNERRAPQHPEQCTLPTATTKRRLGEDAALHQMALEACAGVEEVSREFCIFDVVAAETGEVASWKYCDRHNVTYVTFTNGHNVNYVTFTIQISL